MTTDPAATVADHYGIPDLDDRILTALAAAGKDVDALAVDDLAPVDAFHIRGRAATEELVRLAGVEPGAEVLDVGCGVGGTSRHLAHAHGCRVTGIDLTESYCRAATMLSARVGLAERTTFRTASALDLPFPDASFDLVWTEHVQMNVADKARFYGEMARVVRPGGHLAFHDVFAGPEGVDAMRFPVPWATDASISHLARPRDVERTLADLGFVTACWEDRTEVSRDFFRAVLGRVRDEGWMPLGLHLLMGDTAAEKFENVLANLEADRVRVVQAVLRRS